MAEPETATLAVATLPSSDDLERATSFAREPFLLEGEDAATALAPGTPRRRALDSVLAELDEGHKVPSTRWRRRWSLLLGLDRLLSQDEPALVDGTVLSAHQVDALSGTLTALLAEAQRNGNGRVQRRRLPTSRSSSRPRACPARRSCRRSCARTRTATRIRSTGRDPDEEVAEDVDDPNAAKRFWFEHATGAGKTVAALGFVEASRTGGILILTHRRNLVDQFHGELRDRGYAKRISPALLGDKDPGTGPVTVETYQWFVRNAGKISDAYTIVICDEAHTALGEKTSAAIRAWTGPVFVGMTATGALIARHVTDLFPTQTSRFDLAQAARRGVIAPLRCVRIPPGPGVRTIAKVPLRRGEVDTEFDQEMLAELLDQLPFNLAVADLYKTRFNGVPGVVYSAGVRHAYNVAEAFRERRAEGAGRLRRDEEARAGADPRRLRARGHRRAGQRAAARRGLELAARDGLHAPRADRLEAHLPAAGRPRHAPPAGQGGGHRRRLRPPGDQARRPGRDAAFAARTATSTAAARSSSGPVRRGRGRRLRVERRVVPVTADENRRIEVFERELWRIAVEYLDYGEQVQWAALAGARVAPAGWRRARAMLHFDEGGELKRAFLLTAVERNKNPQLRIRALQEIAASRDAEAFDRAIEMVAGWPRDEKREGVKVVLQSLAEKKIGRRDQANNWIWACAEMTREVHEEYAVQRWPETKRLLGLLVNSSGGAHARNARRLVHAARQQDRRLAAALLAAALPHTAEAGEVINGARTRMSRKPAALARELLRNFPKGKGRRGQRRRKKGKGAGESQAPVEAVAAVAVEERLRRSSRRSRRAGGARRSATPTRIAEAVVAEAENGAGEEEAASRSRTAASGRRRRRPRRAAAGAPPPPLPPRPTTAAGRGEAEAEARGAQAGAEGRRRGRCRRRRRRLPPKPKRAARKRAPKPPEQGELPKPAPRRRAAKPKAGGDERRADRARARVERRPRGRPGRLGRRSRLIPPRMSPRVAMRPRDDTRARQRPRWTSPAESTRSPAVGRHPQPAVGVDPRGDALAAVPAPA